VEDAGAEPTLDERRAVIGPRADKYLAQWSQNEDGGFNWGAFVFAILWFPFRRMYRLSAALWGGLFVIVMVDELCLQWLGVGMPRAAERGLSIGLAVFCGRMANRLYRAHVERVVVEERRVLRSEDEQLVHLRRRGGISFLAPIAFFVVFVVAGAAMTVLSETVKETVSPALAEDDPRMKEATDMARRTVGTFLQALQEPRPSQSRFGVLMPVTDGKHTEDVWIAPVTYDGRYLRGRIDEAPESATGLKIGDEVTAEPSTISDWMYVDGKKLVGGYTFRVLRDRVTPSERKELDREVNVEIE